MANPRTPAQASFPVPPPAPNLPITDLQSGLATAPFYQWCQLMWAALQGGNGLLVNVDFATLRGIGENSLALAIADSNTPKLALFEQSTINALESRLHNLEQILLAGILTSTVSQRQQTIPTLSYGTYTPTLTNGTNVTASTSYICQYLRVGNVVTVSGLVDIDPTTVSLATELGVSLPIASALATSQQCAGAGSSPGIVGQSSAILGDATNDRASISYICSSDTNQAMYFTFTYQVL